MKKRFLIIFIAILATIAYAFGLAACSGESGTYYKLGYDGKPDSKTYFTLKSGKWTDEDGESGTYKKDGDKIVFYYTFFGETEELCDGTIKDGVLKVNGDTYISEKHKHSYGEYTVTITATCTKKGEETATCTCGVKDKRELLALGGSHSWQWQEIEAPTCVKNGSRIKVCNKCNDKDYNSEETIDKFGHNFEKYVLNNDFTCTEDGTQTAKCTHCNETDTKSIPNSSKHEYKNGKCIKCNATKLSYSTNFITCRVIGGYNEESEVIIPTKEEGRPVIAIDSNVFEGASVLTSITIPNSVTYIGHYAFYQCTSLTSINYKGTMEQWKSIEKGDHWDLATGNYIIHCIDGDITKNK